MDTKHLSRLAGEVKRYIEKVLPQCERAGGFPDSPMDRKSKGTTNPPVGDYVLRLWWENLEAGKVINPILQELRLGHHAYRNHQYRDILEYAAYDAGAFARWLGMRETRREALWKMCEHIAMVIIINHGKTPCFSVITGLSNSGSPQVDDEVGDPRKVAPKWRSITAADAYYSIVARLERIRIEYPGITEAAAEVECQKELEALGLSGSIGRIRHAKDFVTKERGGEVIEVLRHDG